LTLYHESLVIKGGRSKSLRHPPGLAAKTANMKKSIALALALAATGAVQLSHAASITVSFSAVVTASAGGDLLPAVGSAIQGALTFGDVPSSVDLPPASACGATACAGYTFDAAPAQGLVNLGTFVISSSILGVGVYDNATLLTPDGTPVDAVTLGTKVNGPSYMLTLAGAPDSFSGVALSDGAALLGQWQYGQFTVWSSSSLSSPVLLAQVTSVNVSAGPDAVPEPTTVALFALGLGGVALAARRRASPAGQAVNKG